MRRADKSYDASFNYSYPYHNTSKPLSNVSVDLCESLLPRYREGPHTPLLSSALLIALAHKRSPRACNTIPLNQPVAFVRLWLTLDRHCARVCSILHFYDESVPSQLTLTTAIKNPG